MSDEEPWSARLIDWLARHRLRWIGAAVALAAVLVLLNGWLLSPSRLPPTSPKGRPTAPGPEVGPDSIAALLRKGNDLAVCRNVVRQCKAAQAERPDSARTLKDDDLRFLRQEFHLDEEQLNEIASPSCTLLDAHYLESCFLFADAARSLQVGGQPDRVRASAAFHWVVRQVRLQEAEEGDGPPQCVLRRGWGGDRDRALVFLALLDQLGLAGCMLVVPGGKGPKPWIPGVLAEGEILLFDTRLGAPLPGVDGREIATLAQLRSRPELFKPWEAWNYDVTPEEAVLAEVRVACPLSALAPRMRVLEKVLDEAQPVRLSVEPQRLLEQYRQAGQRAGLASSAVRFWNGRDDRTPLRALWAFLPPAEGGGDRTRERQPRFNGTVIPWPALPAAVEAVPSEVELGARLRDQFARPFLDFTLNSRLPRDLMLHGQLDDAVGLLVETIDRVQEHQKGLQAQPEVRKSFSDWCLEARKAQEDWLLARSRARTPESGLAMKAAEERFLAVWRQGELPPEKDGRREGLAPFEYLHGQAGAALSAEAAYLLALAKQEQAELLAVQHQRQLEKIDRDTVQAAWRAAADRWRKYRADYPTAAAAPAAALGLARCLEALGERDAALAAVESLPTAPRGWNKTALDLRVRQLKAR